MVNGIAATAAPVEEFILLPERGFRVPESHLQEKEIMVSVGHARSTERPVELKPPGLDRSFKVIDSIQEDGPKLVQLSPEAALRLRASQLRFRLVPLREYVLAASLFSPTPVPGAGSGPLLGVQVVDATTGSPVAGVEITAFTSFTGNIGAKSSTDSSGVARLALGASGLTIDRLYVEPSIPGYWGAFAKGIHLVSGHVVRIVPINIGTADCLRHFYPGKIPAGRDVKVAVVDTGIDNSHPDLTRVHQGSNTVRGEPAIDWKDNGSGHGTHIAGIIGGCGTTPSSLNGLASECTMRSYRVFGNGQRNTTNYQVLKALILALRSEPDVINLSLGGLPDDDLLREGIEDAADQGALVVAAAGNDGRKPIGAPAKYSPALAVSALGRKGTYPLGSLEQSYEEYPPHGIDPDDYIASFSNFGSGVFFAAPGVGVVSCSAGGGYRAWSGTSMSAAVVSGIAAKIISATPSLLHPATRDLTRTRGIINALSKAAVNLGFPASYQGFGRPS